MYVLGERIMVVAFEGWNDAAEAATAAVDALKADGAFAVAHSVDPEDYFDYQYTRPTVKRDDEGIRRLTWPSAAVYKPNSTPGIWLLRGQEPARRWQSFAREAVSVAVDEGITGVMFLGSMMNDVPHTRPILVQSSSDNERVRSELTLERGRYEGPVGILTVLAEAFEAAGIATMSQWASIPHYLSMQVKSPKATLALLDKVTELTGHVFDRTPLETDARKWEASIDAAMSEDAEMIEYIRSLEVARDAWDTPAAKGDAIARQFEQFLRHDESGPKSADPKGDGSKSDGSKGDGPKKDSPAATDGV